MGIMESIVQGGVNLEVIRSEGRILQEKDGGSAGIPMERD